MAKPTLPTTKPINNHQAILNKITQNNHPHHTTNPPTQTPAKIHLYDYQLTHQNKHLAQITLQDNQILIQIPTLNKYTLQDINIQPRIPLAQKTTKPSPKPTNPNPKKPNQHPPPKTPKNPNTSKT